VWGRGTAYRSVYAVDFDKLDLLCRERGIAVQTIKSAARRRWRDDDEPHFSWYEPLREREALQRNIAWVLARPGVFVNSSSDAKILPEILATAAAGAAKPSRAEMEADVERLDMADIRTSCRS
jgi:hypothetical protein